MRLPLLPILILLALTIAIDIFLYRRMRRAALGRGLCVAYAILAVIAEGALVAVAFSPKKSCTDADLLGIMWVLYAYLTIYIPKIVITIAELVQMLVRKIFKRRYSIISYCGLGLALITFIAMWWGALFNRFNIQVNEVEISVKDLPEAFDGYRIVQLSDIHTGSFAVHDSTYFNQVVEKVESLNPDVIFFTGDIVNRHSTELEPFVNSLGRLHAPDGVWSVMGNHDYGDYFRWESEADQKADIAHLQELQKAMGWNMLNNRHTWLRAGNDSIAIIGVENIGDPPFHIYGSLATAYPDCSDDNVKILLSHNPAHWLDSISGNADMNIALTLAGHTHAMQIEVLGQSPASIRYPTWGGLYDDGSGHQLYVNIGLGEVGMPARIGATPEITLITLRRAE